MIDINQIASDFCDNYVELIVEGGIVNDMKRTLISKNDITEVLHAVEVDPQGTVMALSMGGTIVATKLLNRGDLDQTTISNGIVAFNTVIIEVLASGFFMASMEIKTLLGIDTYVNNYYRSSQKKEAPAHHAMPEGFTPKGNDPFANLDFKMDWNSDLKD
jgi:hypothetical protein